MHSSRAIYSGAWEVRNRRTTALRIPTGTQPCTSFTRDPPHNQVFGEPVLRSFPRAPKVPYGARLVFERRALTSNSWWSPSLALSPRSRSSAGDPIDVPQPLSVTPVALWRILPAFYLWGPPEPAIHILTAGLVFYGLRHACFF